MKTIKNILAVLLMTTMVAVLPSCEKDPQIYGKWKLVSLTLTNGEQSESIPIGKGLTVEFKKNGQAVLAKGGEEVAKEYTLHGNNLVLKDWYSEHIIEDVEICPVDIHQPVLLFRQFICPRTCHHNNSGD